MTTTVWLARHGAVHNPRELLYGRLPRIRLTAEGERQADALAAFLERRPLAAIYSSPMLRARKTASVILSRQPLVDRVRIDSDLQEIRTGWQGEPLASLERINWDFYAHPRSDDDESLRMVHDRMQRWLGRMLRRHAGGDVLGVSHGDPILILIGALRGLPLDASIFPSPYIEPATVYRMRFDAAGVCRDVNMFVPHALDSESAA
ncbi:MAG TPA: histidine phosphatase family protein [Chloroflexota bacterium]|jgi:broad specificity phosphatase PhoE|nr:histidine phosphatase family protein [Chloroflexota bacterium]